MKNDGVFYGFIMFIFVIAMGGILFVTLDSSKTTESTVTPVKVVSINNDVISFENATTRYNLYIQGGGALPKIGTTVNLRIGTYKLGGHSYRIEGYGNITDQRPSNDDGDTTIIMPMPGWN